MRRSLPSTFLVVLLALLALAASASGQALPRDFFGVDYRPANVYSDTTLQGLGAGIVRQQFPWDGIEYERGRYAFQYYDDYVGAMARQGIEVLPVIFGTPTFYSKARPGAYRATFYPPRRTADLARFASLLVHRYGPGGSFWAQNPDITPVPIRAWQVWNEPNLPAYWPTGPSARQYTALLKTVGRSIKRADAGAEVVTAGIPQSRLGVPLLQFVRGMYRAGGRSAFDTLAINPYGRNVQQILSRTSAVRQTMNRYRDSRAGLWLTEVGWASDGPASQFTAGVDGQAALISQLFGALGGRRQELGLRGVVYYNWRDISFGPDVRDFWGLHTGLVDQSGSHKPAWDAYQQAAAAQAGR
jgi:hypothetical protein